MRSATRNMLLMLIASVVIGHGTAGAANYAIDWLTMAPTPLGGSVPNGASFNVSGIGNVTVTYAIPALIGHVRAQSAPFQTGNVTLGPDTYSWTDYEWFGTIYNGTDLGPVACSVTYTFPAMLSPGTVYVGTIGLGATTSFGGGTSTIRVLQNGTYLGEWVGDATFGASQFIGGVGNFTVMNSVTGPGGVDPHWNTNLAVVRIDDAVSSLTVYHTVLRGDGIGANIGFVPDAPTPASSTSWGRLKHLYR